jgi:integrase
MRATVLRAGFTESCSPARTGSQHLPRLVVSRRGRSGRKRPYLAAGLGLPTEHALISLLALNGLRVSEATGADTEHLGLERGHRTLSITRKGGKVVTIPLAPRTARAIGERTGGPVFLAADGRRLDRHGGGRIVRKTARRSRIGKTVTPHTLRHILSALCPCCHGRHRRASGPAACGIDHLFLAAAFRGTP